MAGARRNVCWGTGGRSALMGAVVAGACGAAAGQPSDTSPRLAQPPIRMPNDPTTPQRVDQNVADIGPLGTSFRELHTDLRVPTSFDSVYRLPRGVSGVGGFGADGQLARVNGGLIAVFPRSVYVPSQNGTKIEVPPGTVYYIGSLPMTSAPIRLPGPTYVTSAADVSADRAAATGVSTSTDAEPAAAAPPPPKLISEADRTRVMCVFTDEQFAAARVRQILEKAATTRERR